MTSDCSMFSPVRIIHFSSNGATNSWFKINIDVKTAFLQTGKATRDDYLIPLVDSNAKLQVMPYSSLIYIGFSHVTQIPQLFYMQSNGILTDLLATIIDNIFRTGTKSTFNEITSNITDNLKLERISSAPGN